MRVVAPFVAVLFLASSPVLAEAPKPAALDQEKQSLEAFAKSHADCREWTDGCLVCVRNGEAGFACSLPGIACQPTKLSCGRTMTAPAAPPAQPPH